MSRPRLVVHAHFYQPFRTDPFTGLVPPDPTAAPFRDWNERITEDCYRPNAELGTLERAGWNLGPTLTSYLAGTKPDVLGGFVAADRRGGGAVNGPALAQPFHHSILPLLAHHDRRTEILWGLRDFEFRFGRPARGMWLPETAVDLPTMALMAEAGVESTILAPWQADVAHIDNRLPYRVQTGNGHHIAVVFYDGDLSGSISFDPGVTADADRFVRERVLPRLAGSLPDGRAPMILLASDGELYGHHQSFRDLFLNRLVAPIEEAPDRGYDVVTLADVAREREGHPHPEIGVRERTSWSCHHGVLRWSGECPCAVDGRWKAPLKAALDRLAGGIDTVTETLASRLTDRDGIWSARDRYVDVVIGARSPEAFAVETLGGRAPAEDRGRLLAILEAQRWRLGMFASCGWFWGDPLRLETRQVLRAAARAARIIDGLAATDLEPRLVADLGTIRSPGAGIDGSMLYRRALSEIGQPPPRPSHEGRELHPR